MTVLLTGCAGFIGSHLTQRLLQDGHRVIGVDNFCDFYSPTLKYENMECCLKHERFHLNKIDIRDYESLVKLLSRYDVDMIVHIAAMAGVRPSIARPLDYHDVNVNGTVALLEACHQFDIKSFIFASSSSVYGNNAKVPFSESDPVDNPISPYAASKKAGELISHTYHHIYDISTVCLRFFTVYGPRQRPDLAIRSFSEKMLKGEPIPVYGDGSTQRDYTYIEDIINGVMAAIAYVRGELVYDIFNLGNSKTIPLKTMISTLEEALGIKAKKQELPMQPGDVTRTYADIDKSRRVLGYDPQTDFGTGIEKFVSWLKKREKNT